MISTNKRLHIGDSTREEFDLRLIVKLQLVCFESLYQIACEDYSLAHFLIEIIRMKAILIPAVFLGPIESKISFGEHLVRSGRLVSKKRDTDAGAEK